LLVRQLPTVRPARILAEPTRPRWSLAFREWQIGLRNERTNFAARSSVMAKKPTDDLFEKSTMSFGEHLEELRVCLFRGVAGIALGCVIGFFAANWVVRFFQSPLERAME
jgi:hypothetical protein